MEMLFSLRHPSSDYERVGRVVRVEGGEGGEGGESGG